MTKEPKIESEEPDEIPINENFNGEKPSEEILNQIRMHPYKYIRDYYESIYPSMGSKVFSVLSLIPVSLIMPKFSINGAFKKEKISLFLISPVGSGKTSMANELKRITYFPLLTLNITPARLFFEIKNRDKCTLIIPDASIALRNDELVKMLENIVGEDECLFEDTLIPLSNGIIKKIKDIKIGDRVFSFAEDFKIYPKRVLGIKKVNSNDCLKIRTRTSEIICTQNHKFIIFKEGHFIDKSAEELKVGEKLPIALTLKNEEFDDDLKLSIFDKNISVSVTNDGLKKIKESLIKKDMYKYDLDRLIGKSLGYTSQMVNFKKPRNKIKDKPSLQKLCKILDMEYKEDFFKERLQLPRKLNVQIAEFLGGYWGDGAFGKQMHITEPNLELLKYYQSIISDTFKIKSLIVNYKNKNVLRFHSKILELFLKELGLNYSRFRKVPEVICKSSNEMLAGFLRGFYDAESNVGIGTRGGAETFLINLTSSSEEIIEQIRILLLRFGILGVVNKRERYEKRYNHYYQCYSLRISDKYSLIKFKNFIGFNHPEKKKKLDYIINNLSSSSINYFHKYKLEFLKELFSSMKLPQFKIFQSMNMRTNEILNGKISLTLGNLQKITSFLNEEYSSLNNIIIDDKNLKELYKRFFNPIINHYKNHFYFYKELKKNKDGMKRRLSEEIKKVIENSKQYLEILNKINNESENFCFDDIMSIEKINKNLNFYDIEVEDNHNFVANGIFVHNCLSRNTMNNKKFSKATEIHKDVAGYFSGTPDLIFNQIIRDGIVSRCAPLFVEHTREQHERMIDLVNGKVEKNNDISKINPVPFFYKELYEVQAGKHKIKPIEGYIISDEIKEGISSWIKPLVKPGFDMMGIHAIRQLEQSYRYMCSHAFLNILSGKREIVDNKLKITLEDLEVAKHLIKRDIETNTVIMMSISSLNYWKIRTENELRDWARNKKIPPTALSIMRGGLKH